VPLAISAWLAVPILPPKNAPPPRHLSALPYAFSAAFILPHALAGGPVLVSKMVVLRVVPAGAKRRLPFALFLLSSLDAFLYGARRLAAVVPGRSATLRFRRQSGCEESEDEEKVTDGHDLGEAELRFKVTTHNSNQIPRSFMVTAE
tara:strand:- start:2778 stop:3218 length:441 start_codon:yes stop_codon:yes gene_type:complete